MMHVRVLLLTSLLLFALSTACTKAPPPAPDTRAADESAIRAACDDQVKAFVAGDAAKWASFYTDDVVGMVPDAPLVQGKANMQKWAEPMLKDKPEFSLINVAKIEVARSGDLAYEWATGRMGVKDKKGKVTETTFKSLTAWKKQADGSWKAVVDTMIP